MCIPTGVTTLCIQTDNNYVYITKYHPPCVYQSTPMCMPSDANPMCTLTGVIEYVKQISPTTCIQTSTGNLCMHSNCHTLCMPTDVSLYVHTNWWHSSYVEQHNYITYHYVQQQMSPTVHTNRCQPVCAYQQIQISPITCTPTDVRNYMYINTFHPPHNINQHTEATKYTSTYGSRHVYS